MSRQIREAIAEEDRKDIIERLWKGRQERVRKGLPPGGNVPYGYHRNGVGFTQYEAEAAVVTRIFELAASVKTKSAIAKVLEAEGLMRRNGKPWTRQDERDSQPTRPLLRGRSALRRGKLAERRMGVPPVSSITLQRQAT